MKKILSFIPVVMWASAILLIAPLTAQAADTDIVAATVTVQNISLSVSDAAIAYGTLAVNTSQDTNGAPLNDTQTITNDGNITIDINVRGANTANWTLAGSTGVVDEYVHSSCPATCTSFPTNYTPLTTSYAELATGIAAAGTQSLDLGITTPSSSTSFVQQTANVTVQAVQP